MAAEGWNHTKWDFVEFHIFVTMQFKDESRRMQRSTPAHASETDDLVGNSAYTFLAPLPVPPKTMVVDVAYPRFFLGGGVAQKIQLRTVGREKVVVP
jgi:hypothetical protein